MSKLVRWSAAEDEVLLEGIQNGEGLEWMTARVDRSPMAIRKRLSRLYQNMKPDDDRLWIAMHDSHSRPVSKKQKAWTVSEDKRMREAVAAGFGSQHIAAALGRSISAVRNRWALLNKKNPHEEPGKNVQLTKNGSNQPPAKARSRRRTKDQQPRLTKSEQAKVDAFWSNGWY